MQDGKVCSLLCLCNVFIFRYISSAGIASVLGERSARGKVKVGIRSGEDTALVIVRFITQYDHAPLAN